MPRTTAKSDKLDALLAECTVDYYSGTGKGGQNRNRHYNCVRLHHVPTGLIAVGTADRSQGRNRELALGRLAEKLGELNYTPPPRKPTKAPRSAARARLKTKTLRGRAKTVRKKVTGEDSQD